MEANKNKIYYYVANNGNSIQLLLRRTLLQQQVYSPYSLKNFADSHRRNLSKSV